MHTIRTDHAGSYGWDYVEKGPQVWSIRITKLASTPLPRVLVNTDADLDASDVTGAAWKLQARDRDLDSNVVVLPPGGGIDARTGPDLDVLIHVIAGSGHLTTELGTVDLVPGALLWLPRQARRQFSAASPGCGTSPCTSDARPLCWRPPRRKRRHERVVA